jgi:molybdopterin synthase catalytic subunit
VNREDIFIELVDQRIDIESLLEKVADPDVGAHGWFAGVTRRTTDDRVTERLCYEAHRPMAIDQLEKLAQAAVEKFSLCRLLVVHRLGEVPVGEASVVVGCSSAHRRQTFEALAWVMDTLKREIPIWKRETYADGTAEWVHPTANATDKAD